MTCRASSYEMGARSVGTDCGDLPPAPCAMAGTSGVERSRTALHTRKKTRRTEHECPFDLGREHPHRTELQASFWTSSAFIPLYLSERGFFGPRTRYTLPTKTSAITKCYFTCTFHAAILTMACTRANKRGCPRKPAESDTPSPSHILAGKQARFGHPPDADSAAGIDF